MGNGWRGCKNIQQNVKDTKHIKSAITKRLISRIMHLDQTGLLQRLLQKHQPFVPVVGYQSDYSSVGRKHVESALFLFLGGIVGSIVFLFAEIIIHLYKKCRKGK